ncbi:unnamed protein product [Lampetra fluviatilis]
MAQVKMVEVVEVEKVEEVEEVEAMAAREYLERHRLAELMELMMARVMAERPVLQTLGAVGFDASPVGGCVDAVTLDTLTSEGESADFIHNEYPRSSTTTTRCPHPVALSVKSRGYHQVRGR